MWGVSGEVAWQANDWLSIKSISGYRDMDMKSSRDGDNTPANILPPRTSMISGRLARVPVFRHFAGGSVELAVRTVLLQEEGTDSNPVYLPVGSISSGGGFENESKAVFFQSTYDLTGEMVLNWWRQIYRRRQGIYPRQGPDIAQ